VEILCNRRIMLGRCAEDTGYELYAQNSPGLENGSIHSTESPTSVEAAEFLDRLSD
jgi:hypothetical protein